MSGTASLHIATTDIRLSSKADRYWSRSVDSNVPGGGPPAFVTRISMLEPNISFAFLTSCVDPSTDETSAMIGIDSGMFSAAWLSLSSFRPEITTLQPAVANAFAVS